MEACVGGDKNKNTGSVFIRRNETLGSSLPHTASCLHGLSMNNVYVNKVRHRLNVNLTENYNLNYIIKSASRCVCLSERRYLRKLIHYFPL